MTNRSINRRTNKVDILRKKTFNPSATLGSNSICKEDLTAQNNKALTQ